MAFDPLELITYSSLGIGAVVGFLTIRNEIRKGKEEQQNVISNQIKSQTNRVIEVLDDKLKIVDEKFKTTDRALAENKEDIEDVEDEMKGMIVEFRKMCDTISKHNYVLEEVLPEFRALRKEFYAFKGAIDNNLLSKKADDIINTEKT